MSCFILAMLLVPLAQGPIRVDDGPAIVEPVKSAIPQTLDAPKMPPKATDKASTKPSDAKKKSKKK